MKLLAQVASDKSQIAQFVTVVAAAAEVDIDSLKKKCVKLHQKRLILTCRLLSESGQSPLSPLYTADDRSQWKTVTA